MVVIFPLSRLINPPFGPPLSFVEWASGPPTQRTLQLQLHPHSKQKKKIQLAVKSTDNIVRSASTLCLYIISKRALSRNKILIIHRQRLKTLFKSFGWFEGVWVDVRCMLQTFQWVQNECKCHLNSFSSRWLCSTFPSHVSNSTVDIEVDFSYRNSVCARN